MGGVDEIGNSLWLDLYSVTGTDGVKFDVTSEVNVSFSVEFIKVCVPPDDAGLSL